MTEPALERHTLVEQGPARAAYLVWLTGLWVQFVCALLAGLAVVPAMWFEVRHDWNQPDAEIGGVVAVFGMALAIVLAVVALFYVWVMRVLIVRAEFAAESSAWWSMAVSPAGILVGSAAVVQLAGSTSQTVKVVLAILLTLAWWALCGMVIRADRQAHGRARGDAAQNPSKTGAAAPKPR